MVRQLVFLIAILTAMFSLPARAQDALNLPADLYVLLNEGEIQRYGVGASGETTLTPSGLFIVDFGVDTQGERIAFRTESGLFVIDVVNGGQPQLIEGPSADVPPYRGEGDTIAWSPNGDAIAYTTTYGGRVYFNTGAAPVFVDLREGIFKSLSWSPGGRFLAAEADQNVWWIYRRQGSSLTLTSAIPSSIGTAWVSDSEIVFAPADGGLRLMNLDQANAQAVLLDESVMYRMPTLNAQDALVFFGRDPNDANVPDGYGRLLRLKRGAQQVETIGQVPIALANVRWAPGGSLLVAFQGGVIALYDPSTGLGFPLPIQDVVAYDWGPLPTTASSAAPAPTAPPTQAAPAPTQPPPTAVPPTAEPPTVEPTQIPISTVTALKLSADGFFLAPDAQGIVQVWKLSASGQPPQPFTQSGSDVSEFAVAPYGKTVAYVVDAQLWVLTNGQQPQLIAKLNDFVRSSPLSAATAPNSLTWTRTAASGSSPWPTTHPSRSAEYQIKPTAARSGRPMGRICWSMNTPIRDGHRRNRREHRPIWSNRRWPSANDPRPTQTHWLRDNRIYTYVDATSAASASPGFYLINADAPGTSSGTVGAAAARCDRPRPPPKPSAARCASCWRRGRTLSRRCTQSISNCRAGRKRQFWTSAR